MSKLLNSSRLARSALVAALLLSFCSAYFFTLARPALAASARSTVALTDPGDNYPTQWRDPVVQDSVVDTWGEYNRECTSWASFALSDRNGYQIPFHDYAKNWGTKATAIGFPPDNTPAKGAIAWWAANAPGASQWGHVAWVSNVDSNGGITVEQYNADFTGHYSTAYFAKTSGSWPTGFIHFKDISQDPVPPSVPWSFENLEGASNAVSPYQGNVGHTPSAVMYNGQEYVFHYDTANQALRLAYTNPGWYFITVDGKGGSSGQVNADVGQVPDAVVFNNTLYVFYYDNTNGNLRMSWSTNGTWWQAETLDGDSGSLSGYNANVGQTPYAVVYNNSLQLFYYQPDQGVLRHAWSGNGSSWSFETLDGSSGSNSHFVGNVGLDTSATVYNGTLQLFYTNTSQGDLRHAWSDANGWHFENLDGDAGSVGHSGDNVGGDPSAFVFQSNLGVLYYDSTKQDLRHAWSDANGWHFEALLGGSASILGGVTPVGSSITTLVNGTTLQVFVYQAQFGDLDHLWNDGSWHKENLDGAGGSPSSRVDANVGLDPVAIMNGTSVVVFYYDADHGALRHAWSN